MVEEERGSVEEEIRSVSRLSNLVGEVGLVVGLEVGLVVGLVVG